MFAEVLAGTARAQFFDVSAGLDHSLALRCDGTVEAWGNSDWGQCNVPALPAWLAGTNPLEAARARRTLEEVLEDPGGR